MTRLYLVRHGENRANVLQIFSCKYVDFPLTPNGLVQARQVGTYLRRRGVDRVYSSPLRRAIGTAEVIARQAGLIAEVVEGLIEVDVGQLEGRAITKERRSIYNSILESWLCDRTEIAFPDGENHDAFFQRAESALNRIISRELRDRVVVVGHGGFFKAVSKLFCPNLDPAFVAHHPYPNCGVSEIELAPHESRLTGELRSWGRRI